MEFKTRCVHGEGGTYDKTGSVSVPIFQTATFARPEVGASTGFDYSRLQNPTRLHLEKLIADLEGGVEALAFSTGMAAVSTLMELFEPGDHMIASDNLYGGSYRLFEHISKKNGLEITYVDTAQLSVLDAAFRPETKMVFVETPTNPMMQVTDLEAVSQRCKARKVLLAVDNTFLTPHFQRPIELGADFVVHSGTKYLGGHNDTLAGFLVAANEKLAEKLRFLHKTIGACLSPFDSWLMIRGIKTLPLRMAQQEKNAQEIANWLDTAPYVNKVYYAGLPSHPGYAVSKRQATGFGAMLSFEVDSEARVHRILSNIRLIQFAESLGGVETLMTYPALQTHADVPKDIREAKGINDKLLRLSVGIESVKDLIEDLKNAMA